MACAIYCDTGHISHIYQSSDPSQPHVFHGNTCAHDMNVVSTAPGLLCTPDDVNDMLSVIFIGPGKCKLDCLKNMFHIHRSKIQNILVWLKSVANNPLYQGITVPYQEPGHLNSLSQLRTEFQTICHFFHIFHQMYFLSQ